MVGDGARELRELRLAAKQVEGARIEDSQADEVAATLAALVATVGPRSEGVT